MDAVELQIVNFLIVTISLLMISASPHNPTKQCINSQPGDLSFGFSVAVNDRYLAAGDPKANQVVIYTSDRSGKWIRTKELSPPKDSVPDKIGSGFGRNLQLDGDVLVINALTEQNTKDVTNPEDFQQRTILTSSFYGRYLIRLDSETEVKAIDLPVEKKEGLVQLNLLSEGEIKQVTLPDNQEVEDIEFDEGLGFG